MTERLVPLEAGAQLPPVRDVGVVSITDDRKGLLVILEDAAGREIKVYFAEPFAYRNMDEGNRLRTLEVVSPSGLDVLCEMQNSAWLEWFHEESYEIRRSLGLRHYFVLTPDDWIDVIAVDPPVVEIAEGHKAGPKTTV